MLKYYFVKRRKVRREDRVTLLDIKQKNRNRESLLSTLSRSVSLHISKHLKSLFMQIYGIAQQTPTFADQRRTFASKLLNSKFVKSRAFDRCSFYRSCYCRGLQRGKRYIILAIWLLSLESLFVIIIIKESTNHCEHFVSLILLIDSER